MKIGIQSGYIFRTDDYAEGLRRIREAGFESVDLNIDEMLDVKKLIADGENPFFSQNTETIEALFVPMKAQADALGLQIGQMHAPFPVYADGNESANRALFDAMCKCMAVCRVLDCPYLIVHPIAWNGTAQEEWDKNIGFYSALIPAAKKYGVCICLENMFHGVNGLMTEAVCSDCITAAWYIDTLNEIAGEECFGFCFDLGHMTLLGKHICESLKTLGGRVKILHLHDNDNIQDNHAIPYSYARTWGQYPVTDWEGLIAGLRAINYRGNLDFEVATGVRLVPEEVRPAQLAYVHAIGEYFAKKILE